MNANDDFDGWKFIDWDIDTDNLQFQLHALEAWNQKNPDVTGHWNQWPDEMDELIVLPLGYIPLPWVTKPRLSEQESMTLKQDWLKLAQIVSENDSIKIEDNTFTVKGKHGSTFRFDVSIQYSVWLPPNRLETHVGALFDIKNGRRGHGELNGHIMRLQACVDMWRIETVAQEGEFGYHDYPPHMTELKEYQYEGYYTFAYATEGTFPISLIALFEMLIEDEEVWRTIHVQFLEREKAKQEFDEKWPNGRPEDWMYL
ncbi:MAG: hypothetical protein OR994_06860 [Candidatus Poseidoniales archaeon]|nr:hypothetical protein [Candidatus Poseidoniales archaeon]